MEDQQIEILKTLYSQQQSTAHILRERMSKITTGATGLLIVVDGWIITSVKNLTDAHLLMLVLSIIVIIGVSIYSLNSRYKEFSAVARLIVRIERAMKLYDPGFFIENEPLYPSEYENLGQDDYEHGKNIFRSHAYILAIFGLLSICLAAFA